jgi:Flp pilus assembly protein TadG
MMIALTLRNRPAPWRERDVASSRPRLRRRSDESGVALVEFALIAPVLFLVLFAILDFGRALNYWQDATHLTAEGARYAAVDNNPGSGSGQTLQQYLLAQADSAELKNGSGSVTTPLRLRVTFPNGGTPAAGDPVKVSACFKFKWLPILNLLGSTIRSDSTMRLEKAPTLSNYTPNPSDCP